MLILLRFVTKVAFVAAFAHYSMQQEPDRSERMRIMAAPDVHWALPVIDRRRCTGCGLCAQLCPTNAVEILGGRAHIVRPADCSFCDVCESYCPEGAIGRPFTVIFGPQVQHGEQMGRADRG